jgi:hypothetical protein
MGPIVCPEKLVRNYHSSLRNNPEKRSYQDLLWRHFVQSQSQNATPNSTVGYEAYSWIWQANVISPGLCHVSSFCPLGNRLIPTVPCVTFLPYELRLLTSLCVWTSLRNTSPCTPSLGSGLELKTHWLSTFRNGNIEILVRLFLLKSCCLCSIFGAGGNKRIEYSNLLWDVSEQALFLWQCGFPIDLGVTSLILLWRLPDQLPTPLFPLAATGRPDIIQQSSRFGRCPV